MAPLAQHGAVVSIIRESPKDIKVRDLFIHLDDRPQETLAFGQSLDLTVAAGPHHLRIGNGFAIQEIDFEIAEGERAAFFAANMFMDRIFAPFIYILGGSIVARVLLTGPEKSTL